MSNQKFVVTISHQFGSGGAFIGQKLSEQLGIPFIDREILKNVATELNVQEADLALRDERRSTFWENISRTVLVYDPSAVVKLDTYMITDTELFRLESAYIERIANETSAVILGRLARYILRSHPHRISIFVTAHLEARIKRVSEILHLSPAEAEKFIETNDRERAAYVHSFTKQDWMDARLYDLCINTSILGFEKSATLVKSFVEARRQQG